jgi:hydrogenase expression/formation protein HypC
MCWSVPGKIVDIKDNIATVDISGLRKEIVLTLLSEPRIGDYVLVHAGYAIGKVNEEEANFTIDFFKGTFKNA